MIHGIKDTATRDEAGLAGVTEETMKVIRSSKCSLRFATKEKRDVLAVVIAEYVRVCNWYLDLWWNLPQEESFIKASSLTCGSWLGFNLHRMAAKEALDMVKSSHKSAEALGTTAAKPRHNARRIQVGDMTACARLQVPTTAEFDWWLHLTPGDGLAIDMPIKAHKQMLKLLKRGGKLNQACVLSKDEVIFSFTVETGEKRDGKLVGVDLGINTLMATSEGTLLGQDTKDKLQQINRCKHGSKRQKGLRIAFRNRARHLVKQLPQDAGMLFLENLKGISQNTKSRVGKPTRKLLGTWNQRFVQDAIKTFCEDNRVAYRTVSAFKTSQTCSNCGRVDKKSRQGTVFECVQCHFTHDADINAAKNILARGLQGVERWKQRNGSPLRAVGSEGSIS